MSEAVKLLAEKASLKLDSFEWEPIKGEEPIQIFFKPMTMGEMRRINEKAQGDNFDANIYTIIEKSLDASEQKKFDLSDKGFFQDRIEGARIIYASARLNGKTHEQATGLLRNMGATEEEEGPND